MTAASLSRQYIAVGAGAALGALARYLLTVGFEASPPLTELWATGAANVAGSLVIGLAAALTGPEGRLLMRPAARLFVMAGLCGGFTTFSMLSLEALTVAMRGDFAGAAAYAGSSIALALAAVWAGYRLGAAINR